LFINTVRPDGSALERKEATMRKTPPLLALAILSLLTASFGTDPARAEDYPARPVKMIVPYPPGGGNDLIARILAQKLSETGGQFYVENLPGAGSAIGTGMAAKAPADGYTVVVVNPDFVVQPIVKAKVPYDPFKSFAPVMLVAVAPESISIHPSLPVTNFKELIALLKSNPGKYSVALPGYGTSPHLASERLFRLTHGVEVVQVPFQGSAPAVTSTMAGHTAILPFGLAGVAPFIKQGKLRGLAVADSTRSMLLPDVPTLEEAGVLGHNVGFWIGLLAPAETPTGIIKHLNQQIARIVSSPDVHERLTTLGFRPIGSTPDQFQAHIKAETTLWTGVVREAGIKID
jgi:tripartite-type tricarboxylate transporter receptor subunit TctC